METENKLLKLIESTEIYQNSSELISDILKKFPPETVEFFFRNYEKQLTDSERNFTKLLGNCEIGSFTEDELKAAKERGLIGFHDNGSLFANSKFFHKNGKLDFYGSFDGIVLKWDNENIFGKLTIEFPPIDDKSKFDDEFKICCVIGTVQLKKSDQVYFNVFVDSGYDTIGESDFDKSGKRKMELRATAEGVGCSKISISGKLTKSLFMKLKTLCSKNISKLAEIMN